MRVLVVDDHELFRRGLMEVLAEETDIEVVGEASSGQQAVQKVAELQPEVVFMDLQMPGQSGIETTAILAQTSPQVRVLILTVSEEPSDLFRALSLGAQGYILKTARPQDIVDALRQVYQGWVVISPAMAPRFLSELKQPTETKASAATQTTLPPDALEAGLTSREQELLQLLARGLTNSEIAGALTISENTVKTHVKNILGKLQLKNRKATSAYASQQGPVGRGQAGLPS